MESQSSSVPADTVDTEWILIPENNSTEDEIAIEKFREYLRIKTVQPNPDYAASTEFLRNYGLELGLEYSCHEVFQSEKCVPGKPIVILTLRGTMPELPSILLNSHTDVVPVSAV
jgi:aminoacylase